MSKAYSRVSNKRVALALMFDFSTLDAVNEG